MTLKHILDLILRNVHCVKIVLQIKFKCNFYVSKSQTRCQEKITDLNYTWYENKLTWSHKNTYLCALSVRHRFTYLTARFTTVSKRNVHWVALKHRFNTWTLVHFYYVYIGTYCCVFITSLQKRIAVVQNSNIRGLSLKVNALSCWMPYTKPNPKPTR